MISMQQAANKPFKSGAAQGASAGAAGGVVSFLKRRIDTRCEDYSYQVEAERRDLAAVVVLGYN